MLFRQVDSAWSVALLGLCGLGRYILGFFCVLGLFFCVGLLSLLGTFLDCFVSLFHASFFLTSSRLHDMNRFGSLFQRLTLDGAAPSVWAGGILLQAPILNKTAKNSFGPRHSYRPIRGTFFARP